MPRPIVLIHGYSASQNDFAAFAAALRKKGIQASSINICDYVSLSNEVTIKDIAEGLDRTFLKQAGLNEDQEFDAIVHSTGMLVIRCWLAAYGKVADHKRVRRLKHLIGVAPATWGSPQAHQGRTFLGALVKGNRNLGPDFMEAGNQVLDALELGSRFTWDLAHADLLIDPPAFDMGENTPWVAVYIGDQPYKGVPAVANSPGSDGTVRWAGCGLNTRKITVDLTKPADQITLSPWAIERQDVHILPVPGKNHGTIVQEPDPDMLQHIVDFLTVNTAKEFVDWQKKWPEDKFKDIKRSMKGDRGDVLSKIQGLFNPAKGDPIDGWQQIVVWASDERGDSINDYLIEVEGRDPGGEWQALEQMYEDVHPYKADPGLRCFHLRLGAGLSQEAVDLRIKITADTGTGMIGYLGYHSDGKPVTMFRRDLVKHGGPTPFVIEFNNKLPDNSTFFHPFTTTLVELTLNREPLLDHDPPVMRLISAGLIDTAQLDTGQSDTAQ